MRISIIETLDIADAGAATKRLKSGYLVAKPRVARSGIQIYGGIELDKPQMDKVRVYRPEEEVFKQESLRSFGHIPVTNDHPPVQVDAANWGKYAVGQTDGDVLRDGESIRIPMMVMDKRAIDDVDDGKAELSVGYTADLEWVSGKTPKGETYDAVQRNIIANHIAIVDKARGGNRLRIGDANFSDANPDAGRGTPSATSNGDPQMSERQILVDGVNVTMPDLAASVVQRTIGRLEQTISDSNTKHEKEMSASALTIKQLTDAAATTQTELEKKQGEITALQKQVADSAMTPQKIDALVADRMRVVTQARNVLGDKFICDGKTDVEIRRAVVDAKLGAVATKDMTDAQIEGAFVAFTAGSKTASGAGYQQINDSFGRPGYQAPTNDAETAYNERNREMADAWRNPAPAARQ
jgi:hypothetical protein